MRDFPVAFLLVVLNASAQPTLAPPHVGYMQDMAGAIRPVDGLAGNFLIGETVASGVISSAFSGSFGWIKTDSALAVTDGSGRVLGASEAPSGPALFAFSRSGKPALAYLPGSAALLRWDGATLSPLNVNWGAIAANDVLSIAAPDPK